MGYQIEVKKSDGWQVYSQFATGWPERELLKRAAEMQKIRRLPIRVTLDGVVLATFPGGAS